MRYLKKRHQNRNKSVIVIVTAIISLIGASCSKEHIAPVNQLVKDLFCFQEGSEWTYYDSVSGTTTIMSILEYNQIKFGYPKPYGKVHDFGESIEIRGNFLTDFDVKIRVQGMEKEDKNTAIFGGSYVSPTSNHSSIPLNFKCDQNNNFNCSITYFAEYDLNGIIYKNVYVFDTNIQFYVAKHVGLIRMLKTDDFDWVLINKNVKQ